MILHKRRIHFAGLRGVDGGRMNVIRNSLRLRSGRKRRENFIKERRRRRSIGSRHGGSFGVRMIDRMSTSG